MLAETMQLIKTQGDKGISYPDLVQRLKATLPTISEQVLDHVLLQLQRKGKITETTPQMSCLKGGCGCDKATSTWYCWCK